MHYPPSRRVLTWGRAQTSLVVACLSLMMIACGDDSPPTMGDDGGDAGSVDSGGADADATMGGDAGPDAENPFLPRVDNETCTLPDLSGAGEYVADAAYPELRRFDRPLWAGTAPGEEGLLFVMEQGGTIYVFADDPEVSSRSEFLSIPVLRGGNEEGLLGLAFHPDYGENGRFYVNYSSNRGCASSRCSVIAEYRRSTSMSADASSERRLLVVEQPYSNHNGGDMHFGPDGLLYISLGDGGSGGDPLGHGQNTETLLGTILRIDVDRTEGSREYGIPATNPFADGVGGAPEIYAWGIRNVWRMAFDPSTGVLWAGDVGQRGFEEVDRITEPGNFGWNTREGFVCYPSGGDECPSEGLIDPIHVYPRAVGRSITGGVVYRGTELAELWGAYLFADFVGGQVWTLRERAGAEPEVEEILRAGNVASFGYDSRGEVLIVTFDRGILRLGRGEGGSVPELPERLSETGCFTDLASYTVAPGVIPYQLNVPFWSDGLDKIRHVALPAGESATPSEDGEYDFPVGTLFLKTFHYPDATTGESRRLETRIYARQTSGWRGFTWRWNEEQTDAILVRGSQTETIDIGSGPQTWLYPSSAQCDQCHTSAAGSVLGFNTRQLNRGVNPAGGGYPQLLAFEEAGLLADLPSGSPLSEVGELPRHPRLDDGDAPTGERARAWLDTNCAMCHRADSALGGAFDLRASVPFSEMAICDVPPTRGDLGITDARLLSPGSPTQSLIRERAGRRGEEQMPPLASHVVPSQGVDLLNEWISALSGCP